MKTKPDENHEICPKCNRPIISTPGPDPSSLKYCVKYHLQAFGNYRFCFSRKADERLRLAEREGAKEIRRQVWRFLTRVDEGDIEFLPKDRNGALKLSKMLKTELDI